MNSTQRPGAALRRFVTWLHMLDGSPEAIARGAAVGLFTAFTPTIGFQVGLAVLLATAVRANVVVAAAMVWVTNPITIVPAFAFTHRVGRWACGATPGDPFLTPLAVGGAIVGAVCAAVAYPVVVRLVRSRRAHSAAAAQRAPATWPVRVRPEG